MTTRTRWGSRNRVENAGIFQNAVILVDKPVGLTSFDTVRRVRRMLGVKKVGHSGTLDKSASGVLVICTGQATRLTHYFLEHDKRYSATIRLGITTDSYDSEGAVVDTKPTEGVGEAEIRGVVARFRGEISQMPPDYSALKINGARASDLARSGKQVKLAERKITIFRLDITGIDLAGARFSIEVDCSKGTYIRSLARDIGEALGTGAYLESLRRTASGPFRIEDAVTLEAFAELVAGDAPVAGSFFRKPVDALAGYDRVVLGGEAAAGVLNGVPFTRDDVVSFEQRPGNEKYDGLCAVLDGEHNLLAMVRIKLPEWQVEFCNVFNRL